MGHTETAKDELLKQLDDAAKGLQLTEPGKEKVDLESSGSDVASSTRLSVVSEDGDEEEFLRELEDNEVLPRDSSLLIQEYCAVEDLNKPGLQRAKKDAIQQEVLLPPITATVRASELTAGIAPSPRPRTRTANMCPWVTSRSTPCSAFLMVTVAKRPPTPLLASCPR